jgi:hypothetical protein
MDLIRLDGITRMQIEEDSQFDHVVGMVHGIDGISLAVDHIGNKNSIELAVARSYIGSALVRRPPTSNESAWFYYDVCQPGK